MLFLSAALIMGVTAFSTALTGEKIHAQQTIILAVSIFEAVILIGAAFISIQRYRQQPFAERESYFSITPPQVAVSLVAAAAVIFIGYQVGANGSLNWFLLPVLTLPAVALPIWIVLGLGIRGIPLGTRWQTWSIFGVAMTIVPFVLIFLEAIVLVLMLLIVGIFLLSQPDFVTEMQLLSRQIYILGPESEAVRDLFIPYITKPAVIVVALSYFSLLVPMMEELLKPLGVWLSANKLTSPAQGFALGALSGSAYALIETLGVSAQTEEWASLLLSRVGTGILHITTSALMGAAIFYAIRERRYLRLLATYALAIFLHGFWNALAILYSFSAATEALGQSTPFIGLQMPLIIGMVILAGIFLIFLVSSNRRMKTTLPKATVEEPTR